MIDLIKKNIISPKFIFICTIMASIILQLARLNFVSLWSDEYGGTLRSIGQPWPVLLLGSYPYEQNPPFYFLFMKAWTSLFGVTEIGMRVVSIFFATGSLILIYLIAKGWGDWCAGLGSLLFASTNSLFLFHATGIRMYSLLLFTSLLALWAFFKYFNSSSHMYLWLTIMGISMIIGFYTHYFGIILPGLIIILSLFLKPNNHKRFPIYLTIAFCLLFYLPWMLAIFPKQINRNLVPFENPTATIILAMFSGNGLFTFDLGNTNQVLGILSFIFGTTALIMRSKKQLVASIVTIIAFAAVAILFLSRISAINIGPRHIIIIYGIAWGVMSQALVQSRSKIIRIMGIITLLGITASCVSAIDKTIQEDYPLPNWRKVAEFVNNNYTNDRIVIPSWDSAPTAFYLSREYITLNSFEQELQSSAERNSYLIIESEYSPTLNLLGQTSVVYEDTKNNVRLIHYIPRPEDP